MNGVVEVLNVGPDEGQDGYSKFIVVIGDDEFGMVEVVLSSKPRSSTTHVRGLLSTINWREGAHNL